MDGQPSIPNEVLLEVTRCFNPLNAADRKTLLAIRLVSRAARDFVTPFAFKLWKLRRGLENANKDILSMFNHPMLTHVECLEVGIDSMLPLDFFTAPIVANEATGEVAPPMNESLLSVEKGKDFHALLGVLIRLCSDKIRLLRISEDSSYFKAGYSSEYQGPYTAEYDMWATSFWQAMRLALKGQRFEKLAWLELRLRTLDHIKYTWLEPYSWNIDDLICFGHHQWSEEYDTDDLFGAFSDTAIVTTTICGSSEDLQETGSQFMRFWDQFLLTVGANVRELAIDFGRNNLLRPLYTGFGYACCHTPLSHSDRTRLEQLTDLHLHHLVEEGNRLLYQILKQCHNIKRLRLFHCAILSDAPVQLFGGNDDSSTSTTQDLDPQMQMNRWSVYFAAMNTLPNLREIYLEGLHYLPWSAPDRTLLRPLQGWNCGVPVHTDSSHDLESLLTLQETIIRQRQARGMPEDPWVSVFLAEPECWELKSMRHERLTGS